MARSGARRRVVVVSVEPLIAATGGGLWVGSRFKIGLVIASSLSVGTLFTLFVLPAVYLAIAA